MGLAHVFIHTTDLSIVVLLQAVIVSIIAIKHKDSSGNGHNYTEFCVIQ